MAEALSRTVSDAYRRVTSGIRQGQADSYNWQLDILHILHPAAWVEDDRLWGNSHRNLAQEL
jgi:hypothetical protein